MNRLVVGASVSVMIVVVSGAATIGDSSETDVELVGAGVVSTPTREFASSLSGDGSQLLFNRSDVPGVWHIWQAGLESRAAASKLWFSDSRYSDVDPFVSRSGDRLYFSSDRPLPGSDSEDPTPDNNTWFASKTSQGWGEPQFSGAVINSFDSETFFSESANGQAVFTRFGEGRGRERKAHLMTAMRDGNTFSGLREIKTQPEGLRLSNPAISPNGSVIVDAGTRGDSPKLYLSIRQATGQWAAFEELPAPINGDEGAQFAPYIANDGETLYFSSDRPSSQGEGDIYRAQLPIEARP